MCKELHLYLDSNEVHPDDTCITYCDTEYALRYKEIVRTTQVSFLSFMSAERLFVHVNSNAHEITLGGCEGTSREIRKSHNLPKLLLAGEFDWFEN